MDEIEAEDGRAVATVWTRRPRPAASLARRCWHDDDELKANARLIAAAPELLACLLAYVELEEQAAPYSSSPMRERARGAIAKAEGRE